MTTESITPADTGSYVLNAMDEQERARFETLLASSGDLRNEVTELTDTAVLLGMAVPPVTPSAALRPALMSAIERTAQLPRVATASTATATATPAQLKARARWFARPAVRMIAAAAAVLLITGGVVGTTLVAQQRQAQQQADALAAIYAASDVQRASMTMPSGGTATLVWSADLRKSALIATGLHALPADKTYELWYIGASGKPIDAGLFESAGHRTWRVLSGAMSEGDTVGVTVEPSGGSTKPTTKPIIVIASA